MVASACMALSQLGLSGVPIHGRVLWVSLGLFVVSAATEGLITLAAVQAIERLNPGLFQKRAQTRSGSLLIGTVAIAAVLLVAVGILVASTAPDGIQALAAQFGISSQAPGWLHGPLADYEWKGLNSEWARKASAGFTGLALLYGVCLLTGRLVGRTRQGSV